MTDTDGTYEIWKQPRGLEPRHVITFHDRRDAKAYLRLVIDQERGKGIEIDDKQPWGFSVGLVNRHGRTFHTCAYWCDFVMTDEGINEGRVKIMQEIQDSIAEAMITGGLEGKARRDAVAYGQPLERSEGE